MLSGGRSFPGVPEAPESNILKVEQNLLSAFTTITANIPIDATIPTSSEGAQLMSGTYTKVSSTSNVLFQVNISIGGSTTGYQNQGFSFFIGSATSANFAIMQSIIGNFQRIQPWLFVVSGQTSSFTWQIRTGNSSTAAMYFNGISTGKLFSTSEFTSVTTWEYEP